MLTAVRVAATTGMLVFFVSGTVSLIIDAVPSWLTLGSALVFAGGGLLAGHLAKHESEK